MIRIDRPAEIPRILASRGKKQTDKLCRDYDAAPADFGSRKQTFAFNEKLYGDRTVKEALVAAQHGKCCFCEQRVRMEGDVEHYRVEALGLTCTRPHPLAAFQSAHTGEDDVAAFVEVQGGVLPNPA